MDRSTSVTGMRCPACGALEDRVVESRAADDGTSIRRRRQCVACATRFTTFERPEMSLPVVVKRDGRRQPFERDKVAAGVLAACKGRPVVGAQVEALLDSVEDELPGHGGDVDAAAIGESVLARLRALDPVAALRFASVYKSFEDPTDFEREIQLLGGPDPAAPAST